MRLVVTALLALVFADDDDASTTQDATVTMDDGVQMAVS